MWTKTFTVVSCVIIAVMLVFVGCTPGEMPSASQDAKGTENGVEDTVEIEGLPTFALVTSATIGDRGFGDLSTEGLNRASEEFGVKCKVFNVGNDTSVYLDTMKAAAENYDVVLVAPGYQFDVELEEAYKQFPDTTYIYLDAVKEGFEGIKSVTFAQNEGAFLAGVLAASLTTDTSLGMINEEKAVGFIGGTDVPVIRDYQQGYEEGVAYVDPTIEVFAAYSGSHFDADLTKAAAINVIEQGADVVFQAAGPAGLGALEGIAEQGRYGIGVDTDQGYLQPGNIPSSMLKKIDIAVYDTVRKLATGEPLDDVAVYGISNGGIALVKDDHYQSIVSEEIQAVVADAEEKIKSGEIVVGTYLD